MSRMLKELIEVYKCGTCPTCAESLQAFEEVGIPDLLPYAELM
jgi:7-cyano-7-deazaguanine synthase in queuosine biosynthesis